MLPSHSYLYETEFNSLLPVWCKHHDLVLEPQGSYVCHKVILLP
jgi:hypothetical protein